MGIRGLLTLIKSDAAYDMIDLVDVAQKGGGIEILVDFHALVRFVTETFLRKIAKEYDNEFLYFPLGVYDKYIEAVYDFHKGFEEAGIRLVWIVDGPKGVDELASDQKSETWFSRDKDDIVSMDKVLEACKYKLPLHDLNNMSPLLFFEVALSSLKNAGAEVINLLQGESDDFIAYEFHRRKSYGILTNDTDFVIFRDCIVIFEQLLNHNYGKDNMKLPFIDFENPGKVFRKPLSLKCPVINQTHVLRLFQFTNYSQLIALSILKGNDNTSAFANELQYHLGITKNPSKTPHVTHVAQYIRKKLITSENLGNIPEMKTFMVNYPQLMESISFCRRFYTLERIKENMNRSIVIFDPTVTNDSLFGFLAKMLAEGNISKKIYSIHFGVIHDSVCAERPTKDCPPILSLLFEIRKKLYPYLLDEKLHEVIEWRSRSSNAHLVKVPVKHAAFKTHVIKGKSDEEAYDLERYGIDLFEEVMTHLESHAPLNYVKKYGIEKAFMCYNLRYMYSLTKDKNLKLSKEEFQSLFVTVFYQFSISKNKMFTTRLNQDMFLGMKICPSERCMIIGSWFMNIYFTTKYLCGATFNLMEEFPSPGQVMSGPVLYSFYENTMSTVNERTSHLDEDLSTLITSLDKEILTMYEIEFEAVTQ